MPAQHNAEAPWPGLAAAAAARGVLVGTDALAQLITYRDLLAERSLQFNLTAIRDPEGIERRLMLDALSMIPALDAWLPAAEGRSPRAIDVGSGAGFPGLVLKIARPDLDVVLIDATGKKVRFLQEVIEATGLRGISAVHGRAEELARDPSYRERFHLTTARAVASLPVLLELTTPFLDVGGVGLFPKSLDLDAELKHSAHAARVLGCRFASSVLMPGEESRLVIVEKTTLTPRAYPRATGIPSQTPLGGAS
ncbi:MAG: 16S rRNA (guanine(527)-N(7))-methyltransferase RsmG [Thermomicrobiales bacterium]